MTNKKSYKRVLVFLSSLILIFFLSGFIAADENQDVEEESTIQIPKDLDEALEFLIMEFSEEDLNEFKNTEYEKLYEYHFGLGMWIRNEWGLWAEEDNELTKYFLKLGISHPDNISGIIIESLWFKINNKQVNLLEIMEPYLLSERCTMPLETTMNDGSKIKWVSFVHNSTEDVVGIGIKDSDKSFWRWEYCKKKNMDRVTDKEEIAKLNAYLEDREKMKIYLEKMRKECGCDNGKKKDKDKITKDKD